VTRWSSQSRASKGAETAHVRTATGNIPIEERARNAQKRHE
jgi:hypothetical protein